MEFNTYQFWKDSSSSETVTAVNTTVTGHAGYGDGVHPVDTVDVFLDDYDNYFDESYDDDIVDEVGGLTISGLDEPEPVSEDKEADKEADRQPRLNLDDKIEVDGETREIELHDCGLYVFKAGEHFSPPPPPPSPVVGMVMTTKENDDVLIASSKNTYISSGLVAPVSRGYKTVHMSAAFGMVLKAK